MPKTGHSCMVTMLMQVVANMLTTKLISLYICVILIVQYFVVSLYCLTVLLKQICTEISSVYVANRTMTLNISYRNKLKDR